MIHNKSKLLLRLGLLALVMLLSGSLLTFPAYAVTLQVNNGVTCSDVTGNPYCTIGAAVAAANAGDTIEVFSGNYAESVDLSTMNTPGDITLIAIDGPGTVTVSPDTGPAFYNSASPFPGDVTIDGFNVTSPDADGISTAMW